MTPARRLFLALSAATLLAACSQGGSTVATSDGKAAVGGPFTLVNQDGQAVSEDILKGRWSAIYFGFTYCPDVCPTSLMVLADGLEKLGRDADKVQTYLISVDPERDTPQALKAYIDNPEFPKNLQGLTGTPEQVAEAAKAYKLYYKKSGEGEGYLVDHLSIIYLMNPDGELARPLAHGLSPDEIAAQIRDAMKRA